MTEKISQATIKISPRILEHLGISAYNSLKKCISELVINAYDADATIVDINLDLTSKTISIIDNGVGMTAEEIENYYLFIGSNRRSRQSEITTKGRLVIGRKGIGKLAGFGIGKTIELNSVKANQQSHVILNIDDFDDFVSITDRQLSIITKPVDSTITTGTSIKLINLGIEINIESQLEDLRKHLYKYLPIKPDFKIRINGIECSTDDIPGKKYKIDTELKELGKITGFYILASSKQKQPGLMIRVRGRIVTEPNLFGLTARSHRLFTLDKIIGEINADFLDPISSDNAEDIDLINTSRDGFLEESEKVKQLYEWAATFLDSVLRGIEEEESVKRTESILKYPEINSRIEKMPPHIKGEAYKVIKGVIDKLGNIEDEEVTKLIEWIVKYYESNILRELINTITSIDEKEIKKLTELIQDWGISQLNSVAEIVNGQISIISKLENLIKNDLSYEIELHKLIEANLWLIKEGLELWSSDKPLKDILEGELSSSFKDSEETRPDIVAKSTNSGNTATILEFKRPKVRIKMELLPKS